MTKLFISTVVLIAVVILSVNAGSEGVGGLSNLKAKDDEVTALVARLKPQIVKKICDAGVGKCPKPDVKITVNNYKTQTVSGTNYFVSLTINNSIYHAKIYSQPWTNTEEVQAVQGPKKATDEIKYFY